MANVRHIGNQKVAISPQFIQPIVIKFCTNGQTLKFAYFLNLRWRAATISEIEISQYLRNRSTKRDEILFKLADFGFKSCKMLKFAYFTNSKWRTATILEIENSQYLRTRLTDRDEILLK